MKHILVGSTAFFSGYEDFTNTSDDYVVVVDNPKGFNFVRQTQSDNYLFEWKRMTPQEFIDYSLNNGPATQLGKFLVKEFCDEIGFTVDDLKQLQPLADAMDENHAYEVVIYNAYLENGEFALTDEQRQTAYDTYRETHPVEEDEPTLTEEEIETLKEE